MPGASGCHRPWINIRVRNRQQYRALLVQQLHDWRTAAGSVLTNLVPKSSRVREFAPLLQGLIDSCSLGEEVVNVIKDHAPCSQDWRKAKLAALAQSGTPRYAVEIPAVASLRLLICAAASESERSKLSPQAWREAVEKAAAPPEPVS